MSTSTKAAFSLVELLVVLSLLVLITVIVVTGFQNYARYQEYDQAVAGVSAVLNDARTQARASELGQAHGVKISAGSVTTFVGTIYSAGDTKNVTSAFNNVTITPALSGGVTSIVFNSLTGIPTATGTLTIVGKGHTATTTITISNTGVIQ